MRALLPFLRLRAFLAEQRSFQLMQRRVACPAHFPEIGAAQPAASIAPDLQLVVAGV
jgi:hypothetical protein